MQRISLLAVFLGVSLALSFIFSGMEAGVFGLSRFRIRQQMKQGNKRAKVLFQFLANTENFLWTILIGNTLANFVVILLVVKALAAMFAGSKVALIVSFIVAVFLFYAFCDLLPKMIFQLFPNRLCLSLAVPFRLLHLVLSPLVRLVEWIASGLLRISGGKTYSGHLFGNRAELRLFVQEASSELLSSEEKAMISRVLELQTATVQSIAVPITKVIAVAAETPMRDLLPIFRDHSFARLPVWTGEGTGRKMRGVVALDSLIFSQTDELMKPVRNWMQPALVLAEDVILEEGLRQMQRHRQGLAVVLGRDGRELGITTLRDILRFIFGEVTL